jgi:hypothetical protein
VTIPNSVTSIGALTFGDCTSLTSVTIGNSVTSIGGFAFVNCTNLTSVMIGNSVTNIEQGAFYGCSSLISVTIPNSVTNIGGGAFMECRSLSRVYFQGNAPSAPLSPFPGDNNVTAYYLPGTTGWGSTFGGIPTGLWSLPYPLILNSSLGVRSDQFAFAVSWATNSSVVIEGSTDLNDPKWVPVITNALNAGLVNFTDSQWTNHPTRFYRVRSQ